MVVVVVVVRGDAGVGPGLVEVDVVLDVGQGLFADPGNGGQNVQG